MGEGKTLLGSEKSGAAWGKKGGIETYTGKFFAALGEKERVTPDQFHKLPARTGAGKLRGSERKEQEGFL